jgi:hypothetical protein
MFLLLAPGAVGAGQQSDLSATLATLRQQANGQATAAARIVGTVGSGRTLGDFVADAKKDTRKQSQVHGLTSGAGTESINCTYDTKSVKVVQNNVATQAKALTKSAEVKDAKRNKTTGKYFTGVEEPLLAATGKVSTFAQSVFEARANGQKKVESSAKTNLGGAIKDVAKAAKGANDPNTARIVAETIGTLKGIIEATNVRSAIGDKAMGELGKLENFAKEWKVESAVEQVAQKIIAEAKKSDPQLAGGENPMGAGRIPQHAAA